MWLQDLEKALAKMKEEVKDFNLICVEKIIPCADGGIMFKTSNHTHIKWFPDGRIIERNYARWSE